MAQADRDADLLRRDGFVLKHSFCSDSVIQSLLDTSQRRSTTVRAALGSKEIGIGSKAGYVEIVQRSPGRWDVPISPEQFGIDDRDMPWWSLIAAVLGDDAEYAFSGVVSSEADTPAQYWHTDSPHESADHLPPHAINVLLALHDIPLEMGPTEVARGSHKLTNHLRNDRLNIDELIYQHEETFPAVLVAGTNDTPPEPVGESMARGSALIFDDRLMHRGMANRSSEMRHVAYFSYRSKGYNVNTHFETQRSVFDSGHTM